MNEMPVNTENSEKTPIRVPKARRFDVWVEAKRKGIPNREIAVKLGISERQLDKHIREWKDDGTFDKYLLCEWLIVYDALNEKEDLKTTFQALTSMNMKRMKEQIQIEGEHKVIIKCLINKPSITSPSTQNNGTLQTTPTDSASPPVADDSAKQN